MATLKFEGLDEYAAQLKKIEANTDEIIGKAIYKGAGEMADSIRSAMQTIPVDDSYHRPGEISKGPKSAEKESMMSGFGISKLKQTGTFWNVKIGFRGRGPGGIYNSLIARQVESGTSWMMKNPFMSRTVNSNKSKCEETMKQVFDEEMEKLVR